MKTIIDKSNCSKFLLDDNVTVEIRDDVTIVGNPVQFIVADLNTGNATVIENVTEPEDWYGCKYNYVNGAWELCPEWVDPRQEITGE